TIPVRETENNPSETNRQHGAEHRMKVITSEDCGNSPKNIFVQELTIALARADSRYVLDRVSEEVRWKIAGRRLIQGKAELGALLQQQKPQRTRELIIHHVATHGK